MTDPSDTCSLLNPVPFHKGSIYATTIELLSMFGMPIYHRSTDTNKITFIEWEVSFLNIWIQPYLVEFNMDDFSNNFTTKYNWIVLARPEDYVAIDYLRKFLQFVKNLGNKDHSIMGSPAATVLLQDLSDTVKK